MYYIAYFHNKTRAKKRLLKSSGEKDTSVVLDRTYKLHFEPTLFKSVLFKGHLYSPPLRDAGWD